MYNKQKDLRKTSTIQHHGNRLPGDQALSEGHDDVDLERDAQAVDRKARAGGEAWKKDVDRDIDSACDIAIHNLRSADFCGPPQDAGHGLAPHQGDIYRSYALGALIDSQLAREGAIERAPSRVHFPRDP